MKRNVKAAEAVMFLKALKDMFSSASALFREPWDIEKFSDFQRDFERVGLFMVPSESCATGENSESYALDSGTYEIWLGLNRTVKLRTIQTIRTFCNLGLKEAKEIADDCDQRMKCVKGGLTHAEAKELFFAFEEIGACSEIRSALPRL